MDHIRLSSSAVVANPQGLHLRVADLFASLAGQFESKIEVIKDTLHVNGKSILDLVTLLAEQGTELRLEAVGPDSRAALDALVELIETDFTEKETDQTYETKDQEQASQNPQSAEQRGA